MANRRTAETNWAGEAPLMRCVDCGGAMQPSDGDALDCSNCGRKYPVRDGVLQMMGDLQGNNKVAADFYDGPLWPKFRFWEHFTFFVNGGRKRCRRQVLKHLPDLSGTRLLEVAIGDGSNLPFIPDDCQVYGVDISTVQLADCRRKFPGRDVRPILGEAERLPFREDTFDNVLSFGALNYFNDPLAAMKEMARVCKPEGRIAVSDEYPGLTNKMLFRRIGLPQVDRWIMSRLLMLGPEFTDMIDRHRHMKIEPIMSESLDDWELHSLWMKVAYCVSGRPKKAGS